MENYRRRFVLNMLAYVVQRNISLPQLCKLAGIDPDGLKKDPKAKISENQLNSLWLHAAQLCNDPLFGLHFGESLQPAALGVVGEIIQSSSTVGEALTHAGSMTHLVTDLFRMEISHSSKLFTIRFIPFKDQEGSFGFHQMMDLYMALVIRELDGLLLEKVRPASIRYPHVLSDPSEYERVLRCRPLRKTDEYSISIERRYWDEPIISANYELQSMLLQRINVAGGEPVREGSKAQTLPVRIYNYLLANSYLGISSLEDIAANFNISPRNLQRKLKEEGVKYQELADSVRKSLALHYLGSGDYRMKDISYMLGYNELSAFTRAFKRWTGASPANYRKEDK